MKRKVIEKFNVKLNKDNILKTLGCNKESSIYNTVSGYFYELESEFYSLVSPSAAFTVDEKKIFCLLTLGNKISDFVKSFFDNGEGMKGLLVDAMADEFLFSMDNILSEHIKTECAILDMGIKSRLDAPKDFPLSEQAVILNKTNLQNVSLTSAFMFEPVKTFGYILELTDDKNIFNAQHDCSKCSNFNCPRRSTISKGNFEILSSYDYTPNMKNDDSAVCIDIGTTTVAFELVTDKGTVKSHKEINPQRRFGADVLSRIESANRGRGKELSSQIRYTLIKGFKEVTKDFGDTKKIVIAANTTMVHLLMNYSCQSLGSYPFTSKHLDTIITFADNVIGSGISSAETFILGGISAFVGGDITSGLYMCDFDKSDKINMFIDLGTNGEMAIGNRKKIMVTSTAAGPAFEGGRISCGTGSVDGAVCGVDLKSGKLKTINDKPPVGICGTGIIELLSEMKDKHIIDETGLLLDKYFDKGYPLTDKITFTQNDIRQVQMAKSAIKAGIEVLAKSYGINLYDIDTVYLAGGFGYGLSVEKACNIGILPSAFLGKTKTIGNSSLGGCVKYVCQDDGKQRIEHIKNIASEISLGNNELFEKLYIEYMNF